MSLLRQITMGVRQDRELDESDTQPFGPQGEGGDHLQMTIKAKALPMTN